MFSKENIIPVVKGLSVGAVVFMLYAAIEANTPTETSNGSISFECEDPGASFGSRIFNDPDMNPINPFHLAFKQHSANLHAYCADPTNGQPKGDITVLEVSSTDECKAPTAEEIFNTNKYCVDVSLLSPIGREPKLVNLSNEPGSNEHATIIAEGGVISRYHVG